MSEEKQIISMIAAVAENYVIGRDGDLPWHLPNDLKWFVRQTKGKPVIFGRTTFESTGALKARKNIVVTRRVDYEAEGATVVHSLEEALHAAGDADEVMILGGAEIYREFMPRADRFYLTVVHGEFEGDTKFPPFDPEQWRVSFHEHHDPDEKNAFPHTFYVLERAAYGEPKTANDRLPAPFRSRREPPASECAPHRR